MCTSFYSPSLYNMSAHMVLRSLFPELTKELPGIDKRQQTCVTCPLITPPCPVCPSGSECQIISQSCTQCAQAQCISSTSLNNLAGNGQAAPAKSNMGAIAGGIVGALVAVGCIAGALFWYIRRKRRATEERDMWLENSKNIEEEEKDPRQTASIHTHGSVFCVGKARLMLGWKSVASFDCIDNDDTRF